MNSFDEVFQQVKQYCSEHEMISDVAMKTWIDAMPPVGIDGKDAVFQVQTEFQQGVLLATYKAVLENALEHVMGFPLRLVVNFNNPEENRAPDSGDLPDFESLCSFKEISEKDGLNSRRYCWS